MSGPAARIIKVKLSFSYRSPGRSAGGFLLSFPCQNQSRSVSAAAYPAHVWQLMSAPGSGPHKMELRQNVGPVQPGQQKQCRFFTVPSDDGRQYRSFHAEISFQLLFYASGLGNATCSMAAPFSDNQPESMRGALFLTHCLFRCDAARKAFDATGIFRDALGLQTAVQISAVPRLFFARRAVQFSAVLFSRLSLLNSIIGPTKNRNASLSKTGRHHLSACSFDEAHRRQAEHDLPLFRIGCTAFGNAHS